MFKKFSSGILIIILIILLAIYAIVRFAGSKERTFKDKVLSFDQSIVSEILIGNTGKEPVDLKLSNGYWVVEMNGKEYAADSNTVKGILRQLSDLPTKRYAGRGQDLWKKYEVTDSAATLVTLKSSGKTVADIYIGKFDYNMPKDMQQQQQYRQQQGDMTTYVRIPGEDEVYAVDGFLKMNFNRDPSSYRNKAVTLLTANDVTRMSAEMEGTRNILEQQDGKWIMNGLPVDSLKTIKYRAALARLNGSKFVDDEVLPPNPAYSMTIEGNNFTPVLLKAYPVADTNIYFIVTSSANPGAFFNGKEGNLFNKIWKNQQDLLAD